MAESKRLTEIGRIGLYAVQWAAVGELAKSFAISYSEALRRIVNEWLERDLRSRPLGTGERDRVVARSVSLYAEQWEALRAYRLALGLRSLGAATRIVVRQWLDDERRRQGLRQAQDEGGISAAIKALPVDEVIRREVLRPFGSAQDGQAQDEVRVPA